MDKNSYVIIIFFFLMYTSIFSQTNYSELALTGRGNLLLVGESDKLQKEVLEAFNKMKQEAKKEGISIQIASAYRSFDRQKSIWNRKFKSYILEGFTQQQAVEKIIEFSTIPGTSRHHWGTDIDIIDASINEPKELLIQRNYEGDGVYSKLKKWMDSNAENYGFYLVYNNDPLRKGFKYEPWHYSYKQVSKRMLAEFLKIDLIQLFQKNDIKGSHLLSDKFIEKYYLENILDINSKLK